MKSITTTISCLLITGLAFAQRNSGVTTTTGNFSVGNTTTTTQSYHSSNTQSHESRTSYDKNNSNSNSYNFNTPNTNTNNNNIYTNTNSNSNSNNSYWNNNNSNNNNNSYYNNNNSYNNGSYYNYGGNNSNNGYNSYNNANYSTYSPKETYTVKDAGNYGESTISEDKITLNTYSNPFNTTDMMSNYRNSTPIEKFFKQNQKPSQVFVINAQQQNTLTGQGGTIIKIEPNSFIDKNGNVVKGNVEVEMKEMYAKSDMILSNAHTVCNDQLLESGGEVFLGAERNGEPLILANNKPISVEFPATTSGPMQLFNGKPDRNTVNWNLSSPTEVTPQLNANSTTGTSYNFTATNMNWLNCDRFVPRSNGTKINVRMDQQFDTTNTAVFIVFNNQNTVSKLDGFSTFLSSSRMMPDQSDFSTKWYTVPAGSDVTIVAISQVNGQYYSSSERTIIQKDHAMNLMMYPTTLEDVKAQLEKLK